MRRKIVLSVFGFFAMLQAGWMAFGAESYKVRQILDAGGFVEVGVEFDTYQILKWIEIGHERVGVRCGGFDLYDCRKFAENGASIILGSYYDSYDVERIIQLVTGPAVATVHAKGFVDAEIRRFAVLGARLAF